MFVQQNYIRVWISNIKFSAFETEKKKLKILLNRQREQDNN